MWRSPWQIILLWADRFDLRSTGDVLDCVTSKPAVLANTCALITAQMCFDLPSAYSQVAPGTLSVGCQGYNTIGGRKLLTQLNTDAKNKTKQNTARFFALRGAK